MAGESARLGRLQRSVGEASRWREQAATRAAWRGDPLAFATACGITPDPWQAQVLLSTSPRILLNCSRQSGKSTITAIKALHHALFTPGALVLLLSRGQRQSGELMHTVLSLYRRLDRPVDPRAESALTLELAESGSRIIALPGSEATIRGYGGVTLLIVDEASRVADETFHAVTPMLGVSHGAIIALSTPFGNRGWWYEAWRGHELWQRYAVDATQCPRLTPEFLAHERRTMPGWFYDQEYGVQFKDAASQVIPTDQIEAAVRQYPQWNLDPYWPQPPACRVPPPDTPPPPAHQPPPAAAAAVRQTVRQPPADGSLGAYLAGGAPAVNPFCGAQNCVPLNRIPRRLGGTLERDGASASTVEGDFQYPRAGQME